MVGSSSANLVLRLFSTSASSTCITISLFCVEFPSTFSDGSLSMAVITENEVIHPGTFLSDLTIFTQNEQEILRLIP